MNGTHATAQSAIFTAYSKPLTKLILGAAQRVPFYTKHWQEIGSQLTGMSFPAQLSALPPVQKAHLLQQSRHDLLDRRYRNQRLASETTSGSSGQPIEILKDAGSIRRRSMRFLRAMLCCGYRPGQHLLIISTRRTAGLMRLARWRYIDMRDEALLHEYQRARPHVLYGPLTSLLQICEHAQSLATLHRPTVVISTAEQLMPAQRSTLEATFGCAVADFYGMTEIGLIAFRRPDRELYEPASDDLLLEFLSLPDDASAERLLVTDVAGGAMPMIRYETGDLVRRQPLASGLGIREFLGRRIDSIQLSSGRKLSPYRFTLCLETIPGMHQYQVVQRTDLSLDVYFNCDEQYSESIREQIFTSLAELCGDLQARVQFQQHALKTIAGKFRPIRSEVRVST